MYYLYVQFIVEFGKYFRIEKEIIVCVLYQFETLVRHRDVGKRIRFREIDFLEKMFLTAVIVGSNHVIASGKTGFVTNVAYIFGQLRYSIILDSGLPVVAVSQHEFIFE